MSAPAEPLSQESASLAGDPASLGADALTPIEAPLSPAAAAEALLEHHIQAQRQAMLEQTFVPRPPTWTQDAATINLGDFPTLNDPTANAERDIGTLEWLLQDQARRAAEQAGRGGGSDDPPPDQWWRGLLPSHWVPFLKAHRDQVLAGGTGVLLVWWLLAAFARRPLSARRMKARRARSRRRSAAASGVAAPPPIDATVLRKRRRRRHSSRHHSSTLPAHDPG